MATEKDFKVKNGLVTGGSITVGSTEIIDDSGNILAAALGSIDTDDVSEGSANLYFTNARADARITAATTDDLSEGSTNQYFTDSRAVTAIKADADWNATDWDTAHGWGDHGVAGYLTTSDYDDTDVASYLSTNGYATQSTIVAAITDSAPGTLDTLNELAAALGDDPNYAATTTAAIGTKWTEDATKISNWDTAYSWGNHASGGYLTSYTETNNLTSAVTWANVPNANITQSSVTQHQAALSITESQVSDLQSYLTAETNDLSSVVTWANVPDANITQSSVTQHQGSLSVTESQISDFGNYEPEGEALALAIALG